MKKFVFCMALMIICIFVFSGCDMTEASRVNYNLSKQADYFECERRVVVYNARTDTIILEVEGYISLSNNISNELVITAKVGEDQYKKSYVYLNDNVLYTSEDITGTHTDPYHYKWYWHTNLYPEIEIRP